MISRPDNVLRLKDGRLLGYAECGDPQGKPLFFFHGMPGCRLEGQLCNTAGKKLGVRVLAVDRPGYGLSYPKPGRTFLDWPSDVAELADHLDVRRFAVAGHSGGGPYALACAVKIRQRVTAAGVISGIGPLDVPEARDGMRREVRFFFDAVRSVPWLASGSMWLLGRAARSFPDRLNSIMMGSEADRPVLARAEIRVLFLSDIAEAFRSGSSGASSDAVLYARPWGFRLKEITTQVHLWHGEADADAPCSMGRYLAQAIPNCRAHFYPGEGHLLLVDRMDEILGSLIA